MTEKPLRVTDINDKIKRLQRLIAEMRSKNRLLRFQASFKTLGQFVEPP